MAITFCIYPVPSSLTTETSPHTNIRLLLLPASLRERAFYLPNLPPCFCAHNLVRSFPVPQHLPICPSPPKTRLKSVKKESEANDFLLCLWNRCPLCERMYPHIAELPRSLRGQRQKFKDKFLMNQRLL